MRVVSVLPSATEIVHALGHGSELVGRSEECDFPPEVKSLPAVMRPRTWDADQSSRAIDDRVQRVRGSGESLYELDIDLLRSLDPDLLLTQDLCRVCSVTDAEVAAACAKADVAPRIVSLTPRSLSGVWLSVETVGRALNDPEKGRELARRLRARTAPVRRSSPPPRVAIVEWLDPPILSGLWARDMVRAAGGTAVGLRRGKPAPGRRGRRSPGSHLTSWSSARAASRSTERGVNSPTPGSAREVAQAMPPRGVFLADEAFFSRPGPRLADGVELLRNLLDGVARPSPMPVEPWPAPAPEATA